ncbi:hypothetical protein H109_07126 [Trichophyton interdigitale MR816]|uniref:Uncharacterized protein n=1 Tax=Trichophyton interdigitale (strain MR816) TaxID=1215338 RepID=A0A059J0A6_TRIIM|nr:hypothetical protein H101_01514 [Trichophyton interdigitale H6]KDB20942.1 hypothetical protein H109_07126 [Trichophyton interdigitale MR816]
MKSKDADAEFRSLDGRRAAKVGEVAVLFATPEFCGQTKYRDFDARLDIIARLAFAACAAAAAAGSGLPVRMPAHTHARNALHETRKSNPVAASEEHDLAAGEFATARLSITDPSAVRTLRLLEDHHKQLAAIIRFQHENPPSAAEAERKLSGGAEELAPNPTASPVTHRGSGLAAGPQYPQQHSKQQHHHQQQQQQQLQQQQYVQHPPRLLSQTSFGSRNSSIAGNLASARGIPSQRQHANPVSPTVSAQNARARMAGSPVQARQRDGRRADQLSTDPQASQNNRSREGNRSWAQPISPTRATAQEYVSPYIKDTAIAGLKSITGDEPFKRFYSTFEGVISKLSAPLAFASLPLGVDAASQPRLLSGQKAPAADTKTNTDAAVADFTSFSDKDPDVSKLISSAALRAIKDKDGHFGSQNPAESFYVVPTTGGMISYAGILSREEKEAVKDSLESVEDDFVDASENPPSPEDFMQKGTGTTKLDRSTTLPPRKNKGDHPRSLKTVEELHMENEALRHLSDTLAKRLHMWEVNAQSSSLALQQSIRAMHNQHAILPSLQTSPAASTTGDPMSSAVPSAAAASDMRIRELQELIKNNERELEKVSRENEKLRAVVERYRERWEKLKEGARVRREGAGNGNGRPSKDDSKERAEEDDTNSNKQGD